MATLQLVNQFFVDLATAKHAFGTHVFKVMLTNTAPSIASAVKADVTEIAAGNGYSAGGNTVTVTATLSGSACKVVIADTTFTASGGSMGSFRWAVLYNDTTSGKPIVGYMDYGTSITLAVTEAHLIDFDGTSGALVVG